MEHPGLRMGREIRKNLGEKKKHISSMEYPGLRMGMEIRRILGEKKNRFSARNILD